MDTNAGQRPRAGLRLAHWQARLAGALRHTRRPSCFFIPKLARIARAPASAPTMSEQLPLPPCVGPSRTPSRTPTRRALPCVQLTCVRAWQVVARRLGLPCLGKANGLLRWGYANNALSRKACDAFGSILNRRVGRGSRLASPQVLPKGIYAQVNTARPSGVARSAATPDSAGVRVQCRQLQSFGLPKVLLVAQELQSSASAPRTSTPV